MELPTGYAIGGAIQTARGMPVVRAIREVDGMSVVVSGTRGLATSEPLRRRLDAEAEFYALHRGVSARALRVDEQRQSWLVLENILGEPIDTSRAWSLDDFMALAPLLADTVAKFHAKDCVHRGLESSCIWWEAAPSWRVTILGVLPAARVRALGALPPTSDTAPELITTRDQPVTQAADVYSLGSILYRLLAGRPPI